MAAIIELPSATSSQTLYCLLHSPNGQIWNGSAFEVFTSGHWSSYVNTLTEQTGTGYYIGTFPSSIPAGKYSEVFYQQAGGSPAVGDSNIGSNQIYWSGSVEEQGVGIVVANTPVTLAASQPNINIGTVNTVTNIGAPGLASIQAQVQALLNATNMPELSSVPASTPTMYQALMLLYMALRNQHTASTTQEQITNNGGTAIGTAALSDSGTVFTKGQFQ
jgi:hypothetical protein